MNLKAKRLATIVANPRDVRFEDACKTALSLGFVHKGGAGSHHAFARPGEPLLLNFQNRKGKIAPYQARQLIAKSTEIHDEPLSACGVLVRRGSGLYCRGTGLAGLLGMGRH